jgi:hypothetical protein
MEEDIFEEYYKESLKDIAAPPPKAGGGADDKDDDLSFLNEPKDPRDVARDAKKIKAPINSFIKKLNTIIANVFETEDKKGTRQDLIITLVVGGLAFTAANVFFLISKNLKSKMSEKDYETTLFGMYKAAMRDIGEKERGENGTQ